MTHMTTNERVRELLEGRILFLPELKLCEQVERGSSVLHIKRDSIVRALGLEANSVSGELVVDDRSMLVLEAYS